MTYRAASLSHFSPVTDNTSVVSAQNFTAECLKGKEHSAHKFASSHETILIVPETSITLTSSDSSVNVPKRSLVIAPPGQYDVAFLGKGRVFALTTGRIELDATGMSIREGCEVTNLDSRVKPIGEPFRRCAAADKSIRIYAVDDIPHPPGNPRLKFLQSATMSINWVEYHGARDRTVLSPHFHNDFEQGSLAISGDYIHHIRTPWGSNADHWREDDHIKASSNSMLVIPPDLIHTTEGVGTGHNILIDVFAPPRKDFIAKEWMHNSADYIDPADIPNSSDDDRA